MDRKGIAIIVLTIGLVVAWYAGYYTPRARENAKRYEEYKKQLAEQQAARRRAAKAGERQPQAGEVFEEMAPLVPRGRALSLHLNMIRFGKERCTKRRPRCGGCALRRYCGYVRGVRAGMC